MTSVFSAVRRLSLDDISLVWTDQVVAFALFHTVTNSLYHSRINNSTCVFAQILDKPTLHAY